MASIRLPHLNRRRAVADLALARDDPVVVSASTYSTRCSSQVTTTNRSWGGCLAFFFLMLSTTPGAAAERLEGEVSLSRPGCDAFVIKSRSGFMLIHERDYYAVYEGDLVRALSLALPDMVIEVLGETTIWVTVEDTSQEAEPLRIRLDGRCERREIDRSVTGPQAHAGEPL